MTPPPQTEGLVIPQGHVIGVVGPDGAGRSTLLGLIGGMLTPATGAGCEPGRHPLSDLERLCDYLILITDHRVQLAGAVDDLVATHFRLSTDPGNPDLPADLDVIATGSTGITARRGRTPIPESISAERLGLEELVHAYLAGVDAP
jgi:ABC-2 type transport system ATP-binding protein